MKCKKCGEELYQGMSKCLRCGYSEFKEKSNIERELNRFKISKNSKVNKIYLKIFGQTEIKIVKRYLKFLIVLIIISHIFFYIDISNKCFIKIKPTFEFSNLTIKRGIKYLKRDFPNQYNDFCENVKSINPAILYCGQFGGGCFSSSKPKEIVVSTPLGEYKRAAHVIIHETCHAIQLKENRAFDESECYKKDEVIPLHPWQ